MRVPATEVLTLEEFLKRHLDTPKFKAYFDECNVDLEFAVSVVGQTYRDMGIYMVPAGQAKVLMDSLHTQVANSTELQQRAQHARRIRENARRRKVRIEKE